MASLLLFLTTLRLARGAATIPGATSQAKILEIHNKFRCGMCDTPPMTWSDAIAQNAKDYMDTGAASGHCPASGFTPGCVGNGENMYGGIAGDDPFQWELAIDMWFAGEIDCYNFDTGRNTCTSGHMTQVAWADSTEVGCASNDAATGGMKTLCMYQQPGNYNNQYTTKVHKCPAATQYEYYTGAASCCNGDQSTCRDGVCGWEYAKETTTSGCPADSSCSIHPSCSDTAYGDGSSRTPSPGSDNGNGNDTGNADTGNADTEYGDGSSPTSSPASDIGTGNDTENASDTGTTLEVSRCVAGVVAVLLLAAF